MSWNRELFKYRKNKTKLFDKLCGPSGVKYYAELITGEKNVTHDIRRFKKTHFLNF